jgi:hypothetical protein
MPMLPMQLRPVRSVLCALCLLAAIAARAGAQSAATASLAGTVLDASGARVADAVVVVSERATGVVHDARTGDDGAFLVPLLRPGRYVLRVEHTGFKTAESDEIALEVGEQRRVELRLAVGDVQESIAVEASRQSERTTDISLVVDERRIRELPLNGKDFLKLSLLVPGVGAGGTNPLFSGGRNSTTTYLVDGVGSADQRGGRGLAVSGGAVLFSNAAPNLISTEAIREFRVISSNADATYGRAGGGQVSIVTKSGTNDLSGSGYYYHRNDALDARDYFNQGPFFDDDGFPKPPPFKQHQYGGTLGGPVVRDRHFFFGSFEGFRQRLKQTDATTVVPNAALISLMPGDLGTFYRTFYVDRGIVPASGNPAGEFAPIYTTEAERQQFLAAGLRPELFDGDLGNGEAGGVRLSSASTRDVDQDSMILRTDHKPTDRLSLSARYSYAGSRQLTNLVAIPFNNTFVPLRWHHGIGQASYVLSPTQYLELRGGVMRSKYSEANVSGVDDRLRAIGVPDNGIAIRPTGTMFAQLNANPGETFQDFQTVPEMSALHVWTRGPLTLRSGMQWRKSFLSTYSAGSASGVYTFNGYLGPNGLLGSATADPQAVSSSFAVTRFGIGGGATSALRRYRQTEQEYFSQADVQLGSRVTLNMGVRYAYFSPLSERDGLLSNLYAVDGTGNLDDGASAFEYGRFNNRVEVVGDGRPFYQPDRNNFQPRLGAAWDIGGSGRTILRGSYGTYVDRLIQIMVLSAPNSTPFSLSGTAANAPFLLGERPPFDSTTAPGVFAIDPSIRNPTMHRYNVTVEQQLDRATTVAVSYVGAAGRDLTWNADYNGGGAVPQDRRPDQRLGRTTITSGGAESEYNSLQILARRRWARGLDVTAAYTYAKSRDNVTQDDFGSPPALINLGGSPEAGFQGGGPDGWASRPLSANWGYSDFDLRHNLAISHVWEVPVGRGRRFLSNGSGWLEALVGGYTLSGFALFRSGQPIDLQYSGDLADVGAFSIRPVLTSGSLADLYAQNPSTPAQYLIPAAEARAQLAATNVTDPSSWIERNALRGPAVYTYDLSLAKRIPLSGRQTLSVDVNVFNVFNRAHFANPTANLGSAFFGQVSSTVSTLTPRQIQLGLRFAF